MVGARGQHDQPVKAQGDPGALGQAARESGEEILVEGIGLAMRTDKLKRLGLSAPKIKSIREIAKALAGARIDLNAVGDMDADEAHAALVALHGVGPWTADIYLLFCLGHADAFPAGDLALQESARIAFGLRKRPDAKALGRMAEAWRPWRGVAAHLLWAHYHVVKRREGISLQPAPPKAKKAARKSTRRTTANA